MPLALDVAAYGHAGGDENPRCLNEAEPQRETAYHLWGAPIFRTGGVMDIRSRMPLSGWFSVRAVLLV